MGGKLLACWILALRPAVPMEQRSRFLGEAHRDVSAVVASTAGTMRIEGSICVAEACHIRDANYQRNESETFFWLEWPVVADDSVEALEERCAEY